MCAEEGGRLATAEEKKRLEDLLASLPTTQAEDEKLIAGQQALQSWNSALFQADEGVFQNMQACI